MTREETAHKQYVINHYDTADDGPECAAIRAFLAFPEGWNDLSRIEMHSGVTNFLNRTRGCDSSK